MTDDEPDAFEDDPSGERDEVDDPFARLDEDAPGDDAPGDDALGDDALGEEADSDGPLFGEAKPGTADRDPADRDPADRDSTDAGTDAGSDDPFDELGPATGEPGADFADAFEQMDVGGVAEEDVWESLDEDAASGGPVGEFGGRVSEADRTGAGLGGRFGGADAGVERVISKRTYCQQCPYFSAPPDVACDHEGTSIVEAVGFDEFRVRNCPMVDEEGPTFDASRDE